MTSPEYEFVERLKKWGLTEEDFNLLANNDILAESVVMYCKEIVDGAKLLRHRYHTHATTSIPRGPMDVRIQKAAKYIAARGGYPSNQAIAEALQVSRQAVWNAIRRHGLQETLSELRGKMARH